MAIENNEFLIWKLNELEKKVFELEQTLRGLQDQLGVTNVSTSSSESTSKREKFLFNGEIYKKSRLVVAVIKFYIAKHPSITYEELSQAFPRNKVGLCASYECVKKYDDLTPSDVGNAFNRSSVHRYFDKEDEIIVLNDGTKVVVCNQWGPNIQSFIKYVIINYNYEIKPY